MLPGLIARFRPVGPWRFGPESGARDRVDHIFHSDTVYSAVSWAMAQMDGLDEWLDAVFRNPEGPAVRFSSFFPYQQDLLYVVAPRSHWPPPPSPRVRWKGARFVPAPVAGTLLSGSQLDESHWTVDGPSECLLPSGAPRGPFRPVVRSSAAVDRLSGNVEVHRTACLEFSEDSGMWMAAAFAGEDAAARWSDRVKAALRLLADSGVGGERSRGWGRSHMPEFQDGVLPDLILPPRPAASIEATEEPRPVPETAWWLLSLVSPAPDDAIDWQRGDYAILTRSGRVESPHGSGALKKSARMIAEGSVLFASAPVRGAAPDVAPDGFPHPVYRAGFSFAIPIPWRAAS